MTLIVYYTENWTRSRSHGHSPESRPRPIKAVTNRATTRLFWRTKPDKWKKCNNVSNSSKKTLSTPTICRKRLTSWRPVFCGSRTKPVKSHLRITKTSCSWTRCWSPISSSASSRWTRNNLTNNTTWTCATSTTWNNTRKISLELRTNWLRYRNFCKPRSRRTTM